MNADAVRNCLHCNKVFEPDVRHRRDQRYCQKPACRRASKVASRQQWLAKPEHKDWWHGEWNVDRVRDWRAQHPGYWKRWRRKQALALQDTIKTAQGCNAPRISRKTESELFSSESEVIRGVPIGV